MVHGAVLTGGGLLLAWLFGPDTLSDPANAFQTGALVASGLLFAADGLGASVGGFGRSRFVGAGDPAAGDAGAADRKT